MMKRLLNAKYFKDTFLAIIFFISSICTYYGIFSSIPFVTSYGRGLLNYFPSLLVFMVPLFSFIIFYLYYHFDNYQTKWKMIKIYGLVLTIAMSLMIVLQIITISLLLKWKLMRSVTPLFPFDILTLSILFLIVGIISLIWCKCHHDYSLVAATATKKYKKRYYVALIFMIIFSTYFLGDFISMYNLFGSRIDENAWGFAPFLLEMLLLSLALFMYEIYSRQTEELDKKRWYFKGILITSISSILIFIWIIIVLIINPFIVHDSLSLFYPIGYAVKIPFGIILIAIGMVIILISSTCKYIKRYHTKKKDEQE